MGLKAPSDVTFMRETVVLSYINDGTGKYLVQDTWFVPRLERCVVSVVTSCMFSGTATWSEAPYTEGRVN